MRHYEDEALSHSRMSMASQNREDAQVAATRALVFAVLDVADLLEQILHEQQQRRE